MAHEILDHTRDLSGSEQHRLISLYEPPEFVKQASHDQLYGDPEKLPTNVYGDPRQRLYPCHTKAATWMSILFYQDKHRLLHPQVAEAVRGRLMKSAKFWGIEKEAEALIQKMADDEAHGIERLPDSMFALVWENEGRKDRNYPLRNPAEVKAASDWFARFRDNFAFADRMQIAQKILGRADELGAGVTDPDGLTKTAGYGACSSKDIAGCWEKRANLVASTFPDYAVQARNLAAAVVQNPPEARDHGVRVKMAELLDEFDRQTQLVRLYGEGGLERPEEVLFVVNEKMASDFMDQHISTATGSIYEKQALAGLQLDTLRDWLGEAFADEVSAGGVYVDLEKLAEVVTTLPRPDAEAFDRMTSALHIPVFGREKAAAAQGLSREAMQALAAEYEQGAALGTSVL